MTTTNAQRWEYRVWRSSTSDTATMIGELQHMGSEGWELVQVVAYGEAPDLNARVEGATTAALMLFMKKPWPA